LLLAAAVPAVASGPIVVTGATGRTGSLIYNLLKAHKQDVRAFVRNATKARDILKCTKCDESEGIFTGDIKEVDSMKAVMNGAQTLIVATSAAPIVNGDKVSFPNGAEPIDIDWHGAQNQLQAFAKRSGASGLGSIALISTAGTTTPEDPKAKYFMDYISFYKLNFEAELMSSGIPFTIVKPCGLDYSGTEPGKKELVTGHDDEMKLQPPAIARADVARVIVAAVEQPSLSQGLRFDLCSKTGTPTTDADLGKVLTSARYPWDHESSVV
jgi:nucleoside-diphosphate-sugar epimerase